MSKSDFDFQEKSGINLGSPKIHLPQATKLKLAGGAWWEDYCVAT